MLLTGVLFVVVTGIVRYLGSDIPAAQAAFIRYSFGLLFVMPALVSVARRRIGPRLFGLFIVRGSVHAVGVMLWFFAMARIPIAEVTAIGYVAPIFVTIGAFFFLGETMHIRRLLGVLAGLAGAWIILRPGFRELNIGQLAQLATAPFFAASYLIAKRLTARAEPGTIVAMLTVCCTLALVPGALINWRAPSAEELFWLATTAACATSGHYTLTRAFEAAPISLTQPIGFLQLVWASILGIVAFGEPVDPFVILGGAIIVAAASYISHREAVAARREITPPAPATKL